jgi:hypothetical protein
MGKGNFYIQIRCEKLCHLIELGYSGMEPLPLLKNVSLLGCCMIYRQATYVCPQCISAIAALILKPLIIK